MDTQAIIMVNLITHPLIIVIALSILVTACGGGGGGDTSASTSSTQSNATSNNQTPAPAPTPSAESQTQSITLSWNIPSTRENNLPLQLSEISAYQIYYFLDGSDQNDGQTVTINDPIITEYTTPQLSSGTYYFAMVTIDTQGNYSDLSDYVVAIIP
jgi:hypothetical protein